tara:strand:- start:357 stop:656 length:300 start_codon:yes stop_codon:yes gene_type:complete
MKVLKNDFKRYQSYLTDILKGRLEWFEYFNNLERLRRLQQKANWRLYYQKPIFSSLLFIIYLPTKLLKIFEGTRNKYYLSKIENEIKVIQDEIKKFNED